MFTEKWDKQPPNSLRVDIFLTNWASTGSMPFVSFSHSERGKQHSLPRPITNSSEVFLWIFFRSFASVRWQWGDSGSGCLSSEGDVWSFWPLFWNVGAFSSCCLQFGFLALIQRQLGKFQLISDYIGILSFSSYKNSRKHCHFMREESYSDRD